MKLKFILLWLEIFATQTFGPINNGMYKIKVKFHFHETLNTILFQLKLYSKQSESLKITQNTQNGQELLLKNHHLF